MKVNLFEFNSLKRKLIAYLFLNLFLLTLLFANDILKIKEGYGILFVLLCVLIFCTYLLIDFLKKSPKSSAQLSHIIMGAGLLISLILLSYANLYQQIHEIYGSKAFTGKTLDSYDFLYYSITTFTTTGYGDITSLNRLSNTLAASEMLYGCIINTIFIAVLTSILLNRLKE